LHHDNFPVVYIVLLILVILPCFFMALLTFIFSILAAGGWRRLAKQFASPRGGVTGNSFYRVTGKVGTTTYKQGLKITATATGLGIEVSPFVFIGHLPLFIPFSVMHDPEKTYLFRNNDYVSISVGTPEIAKLRLPASVFKGSSFEQVA
jgi:hypothetical protein